MPRIPDTDRHFVARLTQAPPPPSWEDIPWSEEMQSRFLTSATPEDVRRFFSQQHIPVYPFPEKRLNLSPGYYRGCKLWGTRVVLEGVYTFDTCFFRVSEILLRAGSLTLVTCSGETALHGKGVLRMERCSLPDLRMPRWEGTFQAEFSDLSGLTATFWKLSPESYFEGCTFRKATVTRWTQPTTLLAQRCDFTQFRCPNLRGDVVFRETVLRNALIAANQGSFLPAGRTLPAIVPGNGLAPWDTTL